ncbi:hypothetical protein AVEN_139803-1 [Araneus ventricosus]|uniref:Uncharacterized protein n=1 Tax=Araneus ventricosus TaxID=182803 RepID=A0A4Y2SM49_ARAVE|nr:hypothetical protein AVEN_139803-1 [Araneus ventricosus]
MAFLAKAQKVDLLSLAAEVVLDVSPNEGSLELIKLIPSDSDYKQENFKDILKAVTSAGIQKEREQRKKEREILKLEKRKKRENLRLKKERENLRLKKGKRRENLQLKRKKKREIMNCS